MNPIGGSALEQGRSPIKVSAQTLVETHHDITGVVPGASGDVMLALREFMQLPESRRLMAAFAFVRDQRVRWQLVAMVEVIADAKGRASGGTK